MDEGHVLHVGHILTGTRANGPGDRTGIWLSGCSLACPGCFNKTLWPRSSGKILTVNAVADELRKLDNPHITISGGEPLEQTSALIALLEKLRGWVNSVVLFTGYACAEFDRDMLKLVYKYVDMTVAGRYDARKAVIGGFPSSANQTVLLAGPGRIRMADALAYRPQVEVTATPTKTTMTGFPSPQLRRAL